VFPEFAIVDVTDAKAVESWAKRIVGEYGAPDVLINNAGLINSNAPLWEVPPDEFAAVIRVNLIGTFQCVRAFLPAMIARGRGAILNITSTWGRTSSPHVAPYCASKWGVEGLTAALSQELPDGIFTVAVNPGIVDTFMLRSCFGDHAAEYPKPDAWARRAAPFLLALDETSNGQTCTVPS
jgi:NAD(P)-dependent dehydrogenase (short-subunit alcohol dehydrogenase family)